MFSLKSFGQKCKDILNTSFYDIKDKDSIIYKQTIRIFLCFAILIPLITLIPVLPKNISFNNDAPIYSNNIEQGFFNGTYNVQPPGYVLYIYLGRLLYMVTNDAVLSQHIINMGLTIAISSAIFFLLLKLRRIIFESFAFTLILSFSNVFLLGSLTGGNRLFLTLASIVLINYSLEIVRDSKHNRIIHFAAAFAFLIGFRQDLSYMYILLYMFLCLQIRKPKPIFISLAVFTGISFLWLIPLVIEYGGINATITKLTSQFDSAVKGTSILLNGITTHSILNIIRLLAFTLHNFIFLIPVTIFVLVKKKYNLDKNLAIILLLAFLPTFLFQLLIHNGNYVHLAAYIVPLFIIMIHGFRIVERKSIFVALLIILMQAGLFFSVKMFRNEDFKAQVADVLLLQYSYDGLMTGEMRTFRTINHSSESIKP